MHYFLTDSELSKMIAGLKTAISIPFIDDIEDFILEALWEYTKDIIGVDPLYNIRSKKLFDVVDNRTHIGWSVKSLQWAFRPNCEFELVIQRADVYKKSKSLGFEPLNGLSDPNRIGAALLKHWKSKVDSDAASQNVTSKRIMILLKTTDKKHFAILEEDIHIYKNDEINWQWTNNEHNGLQGIRIADSMCIYRWYPSQKQFFERFILPADSQIINITPKRLKKSEVVDILLPYLVEHQ